MAFRNIVQDGDPILHKKSRDVEKFDDRLVTLIDDMIDTMHHANGVGLAAVQVGVLRRVVIVEAVKGELLELVNPKFVYKSEEQNLRTEGCLSFPEDQGLVYRPKKVKVSAQDRQGNPVEYEGEGMLARAFCHELDHLDGITFDSLSLTEEEIERIIEEKGELVEDYDDDDEFEIELEYEDEEI